MSEERARPTTMANEGRVALVTGAARGQGRSAALALAASGCDVTLLDVARQLDFPGYSLGTQEELDALAGEIEAMGRAVIPVRADVRDVEAVRAGVARTLDELGGVDILINNAGIRAYASIDTMSDLEWRAMIDINLTGPFNVTREVVPHMRSRGRGVIINNASVLAFHGGDRLSHYAASKHGLLGLTRAWAVELASAGIRVMSISSTGLVMPGYPEHPAVADIGELLLYLVSESAGAVTGADYPLDTGLTHFESFGSGGRRRG